MVRFSLSLVAVALAVGGVGCAHCDTCDDFPTPCQNTVPVTPGGGYSMAPGGEMPMVATPATVSSAPVVRTAPPASGAFTPNPTHPNSAVRAEPLPRSNDVTSPPPPTSLGDAPRA